MTTWLVQLVTTAPRIVTTGLRVELRRIPRVAVVSKWIGLQKVVFTYLPSQTAHSLVIKAFLNEFLHFS